MVDRPDFFIDGGWVRPASGESYEIIEAATGQPLATCALAAPADVDAAVAAARAAFVGWSTTPAAERADLLDAYAEALQSRARETATLVSRENGMPISLSKSVNGYGPAAMIKYYAGLIRDRVDEVRPGVFGGRTIIQKPALGVVAAITPWNYPQPLAAMKIAPALAAGCTIVLKPSPETAADAYAFADAAVDAGLPAGLINIVPAGRETGEYLVSHPGIDKVAFTGSTAAGRAIGEACGRLLRPVTLELGGKSASIVLEDVDVDQFTSKLLDVSLVNNGQTCHAATRILAPESRYTEIVDAVTSVVSGLVVGDPLDRATQVGPLVTEAQRDRVLGYIAAGTDAGFRVTTGGGVPDDLDAGWYVAPTVFEGVPNSAVIAQEEIFGPVLTVTPYRDEAEAVAIANDSVYGLGGAVWSSDEEHGIRVASQVYSGSVGVNHYELDLTAPFGGVKDSGLGRELGPEGLAPYQVTRSVYLAGA